MGGIDRSWDLWLGARGHHTLGKLKPSYFFIWNQGKTEAPDWKHAGWALKGNLDYELGRTRFQLRTLYSTGNDHASRDSSGEFRTIAQSVRDDFGAAHLWTGDFYRARRGESPANLYEVYARFQLEFAVLPRD